MAVKTVRTALEGTRAVKNQRWLSALELGIQDVNLEHAPSQLSNWVELLRDASHSTIIRDLQRFDFAVQKRASRPPTGFGTTFAIRGGCLRKQQWRNKAEEKAGGQKTALARSPGSLSKYS